MLDAPPNRYHCISKAPQRLLGAIFFAESFSLFQKVFVRNSSEIIFKLNRIKNQKSPKNRAFDLYKFG